MAKSSKGDKYSVILPTYNERQNLPVLVQLLSDVFTKEYARSTSPIFLPAI
jgi:hypothetical protein